MSCQNKIVSTFFFLKERRAAGSLADQVGIAAASDAARKSQGRQARLQQSNKLTLNQILWER